MHAHGPIIVTRSNLCKLTAPACEYRDGRKVDGRHGTRRHATHDAEEQSYQSSELAVGQIRRTVGPTCRDEDVQVST